jgi:hypothetical protein
MSNNQIGNYKNCGDEVYQVTNVVLNSREHHYLKSYIYKLVFCTKIKTSKGKRRLAQIKLLDDVQRLISGIDFVIILDYFFWRQNPEKQEALLFHELCHLTSDETGELTTVPHDVEEFYAVIAKYGDWNKEIKEFTESARQFELFDIGERINAL